MPIKIVFHALCMFPSFKWYEIKLLYGKNEEKKRKEKCIHQRNIYNLWDQCLLFRSGSQFAKRWCASVIREREKLSAEKIRSRTQHFCLSAYQINSLFFFFTCSLHFYLKSVLFSCFFLFLMQFWMHIVDRFAV